MVLTLIVKGLEKKKSPLELGSDELHHTARNSDHMNLQSDIDMHLPSKVQRKKTAVQ